MRTLGWPYPFTARPWTDIPDELNALAGADPAFAPLAAIVASVIDTGSTQSLAAFTSMHDLMVAPTPIPEPPYDLVAVRVPGPDAVALFWRFMIEKYGVHPANPPAPGQ